MVSQSLQKHDSDIVYLQLFIKVSSFIETMQRATVLLQMQSVLVGIPKIHLSRMLLPVSCYSCIRR
jgi:hypothetical protein